jgi:hypothetical protein
VYKGKHILESGHFKRWQTHPEFTEFSNTITLSFNTPQKITSVKIVNHTSAFIEIMVGKKADNIALFKTLLRKTQLMKPGEGPTTTQKAQKAERTFDAAYPEWTHDKQITNTGWSRVHIRVHRWQAWMNEKKQPQKTPYAFGLASVTFAVKPSMKQLTPNTHTAHSALGNSRNTNRSLINPLFNVSVKSHPSFASDAADAQRDRRAANARDAAIQQKRQEAELVKKRKLEEEAVAIRKAAKTGTFASHLGIIHPKAASTALQPKQKKLCPDYPCYKGISNKQHHATFAHTKHHKHPKEDCRFGTACYRADPEHKARYAHPEANRTDRAGRGEFFGGDQVQITAASVSNLF